VAEKVPLGVTVRAVCFIDDDAASSQTMPVYAMLVSREYEKGHLDVDNDGVSPEEKKRIQEEKQAARIRKQVEADLSGYDLETEWVEEIEREDCFTISEKLGGAPPIPSQAYSLWIVDAASKWMVVDSFEFEEYEHALTLKVMRLTDFDDDPGSSEEGVTDSKNDRFFLTVGTGIVNHNGEDVASKGRTLLFEISRPVEGALIASDAPVVSLKYEKNIFHGPVTSLSCLTAEGKHRLVIGAGADVNVEQWGNERLTQVGFFRATMHILDILHFKNFLLLSDAYDSLHFLVWRETDKSLTLLAKDYDPIAVYATGLMSRGAAITFICNDDRQNLQFFQYSPGEAAARGGNKLVCRADYHMGSQTTSIASYFCRSSLLVHSATPSSTMAALKQQDTLFGKSDDDQKIGAYFGTTDGSIHGIVPLSEPVYWRLMALQSVMANALESDCGLNQRAYRLYRRSSRRGGCRNNDRKKGVIDGDFVTRYTDLSLVDQEDLASAIGSTVDLILDNLLEIQCNRMIM
jgi:cleavage and polyadenylation specificity factor subunit 1